MAKQPTKKTETYEVCKTEDTTYTAEIEYEFGKLKYLQLLEGAGECSGSNIILHTRGSVVDLHKFLGEIIEATDTAPTKPEHIRRNIGCGPDDDLDD